MRRDYSHQMTDNIRVKSLLGNAPAGVSGNHQSSASNPNLTNASLSGKSPLLNSRKIMDQNNANSITINQRANVSVHEKA